MCILASVLVQLRLPRQVPLSQKFAMMIRAIAWLASVYIQLARTVMVRKRVTTTRALALQVVRLPLQLQDQQDHKHAKTNLTIAKVAFVSLLPTILQMSWLIKPMSILRSSTQTRMVVSQTVR